MRVAGSGEQGLWGAHREDRRPIALRRYLGDAANEEVYCELRYQGQSYDAETGLYYNRHRYYDAESGQYISPDPIGLGGGIRPQGYVHNPLEWVDPLGLTSKEGQNRQYWKNEPVDFKGNKVYQRDDLFDPNEMTTWRDKGKVISGTNVERMASGRAPIGYDGNAVNLHHMLQTQDVILPTISGHVTK